MLGRGHVHLFTFSNCAHVENDCLGVATSTCPHFQNVHMLKMMRGSQMFKKKPWAFVACQFLSKTPFFTNCSFCFFFAWVDFGGWIFRFFARPKTLWFSFKLPFLSCSFGFLLAWVAFGGWIFAWAWPCPLVHIFKLCTCRK